MSDLFDPKYQNVLGSSQVEDEESSEISFDLEWITNVISRHRYKALGIFCVVFMLGLFVFLSKPPQYSATAKLKIEEKRMRYQLEEYLDFEKVNELFFYTQVQIAKSRNLARNVIENLNLLNNPAFRAPSPFPFSYLFGITAQNINLKSATDTIGLDADPRFITMMINRYFLNLSVSTDRQTPQIMYVSFTSEFPELAAQITNQHAEEYINYSRSSNSLYTDDIIEGLQKQLVFLDKEISKQEGDILKYKKDNGFFQLQGISSYDPIQDIDYRLSQVREQLAIASHELTTASTTYSSLFYDKEAGNFDNINVDVLNSVNLNDLRQKETELLQQWAVITEKYLPNHHAYKKTRNELDVITQAVENEVMMLVERDKNAYEKAEAQYNELESQEQELINEKYQRDEEWSKLEDLVRTRDQMIDQKKTVVEDLQKAMSSVETQKDTPSRIFEIIDYAEVPLAPINRSWLRILMLTFVAAMGAALAGVLLIEFQDRTIHTPSQLEQATGISVLGVIPRFQEKDYTAMEGRLDSLGASPAAESFVAMRTRFLFSDMVNRAQTLMVTSSVASEGKSTVVVNLASSLSMIGKKILVIDCDLRSPSMHRFFGIQPTPGLTDIIYGVESFDDTVIETDIPDLYVIPAGSHHGRPSEILTSPSFTELMNHLKEHYDFILIDTSPVLLTPDPTILSPQMDLTLLVVKSGFISKQDVLSSIEHIQRSGGNVFSTILNGVPSTERSAYTQYGYGYADQTCQDLAPETQT